MTQSNKCNGKTHSAKFPYASTPCENKAVKDGYCLVHHPKEKRKRQRDRDEIKDMRIKEAKKNSEPLPIPSSIEEYEQELKELDASFDYLCKMEGVKDAGHRWIEFSDKWEAFKRKYAGSQLRPDTSRLRKALEKIANPLRYLQEEAKAQGAKLDGQMAIQLSNDANWLKQLAEEELKALNTSGEDKQDELWEEVQSYIVTFTSANKMESVRACEKLKQIFSLSGKGRQQNGDNITP